MNTLRTFSEKTRAYYRYQARQNYLRQPRRIQNHLEARLPPLWWERAGVGGNSSPFIGKFLPFVGFFRDTPAILVYPHTHNF